MNREKHKILVIDDDPLFLSLLQQVLTPQGYLVQTANNYEDALKIFKQHKFSLVLIDFNLAGSEKNGLDLTRDFKKSSQPPEIIIVTGNPSLELAMEAFQEEVYDFITKPANLRRVKRSIDRALEKFEISRDQLQMTRALLQQNQELEKTNQQLLDALEEARTFQAHLASSKKLAGIGEMTASVAHECNNILGAIRGYSQLALRKSGDADVLFDLHKKIKKAVDRAIDVVENLLQVSRRMKPKMETGNINEALEETFNLAHHHLRLKQIRVVKNFQEIPPFKFDIGQLQQVFLNLVTNASHAMEVGGELKVSSKVENGRAILKFFDNGAGIPPKLIDKIFLPFFTTKTGLEAEEKDQLMGSGLGLFVSREIIEAHNGSIEVKSEAGKGTLFRVILPVKPPEKSVEKPVSEPETPAESATGAKEAPPEPKDAKGLKAMVVDDEPDIRQVLLRFLEDKGFEVSEAVDGKECLEMLEKDSHYHLIFLDLMMPRMTGEEVLHEVKDLYPEISVFMMSGYGNSNSSTNMLAIGADRYIAKPFDLDELESEIESEVINKHQPD